VKSYTPIHSITPRHIPLPSLTFKPPLFSSHLQSIQFTNQTKKTFHFHFLLTMEGLIPFVYKAIVQYKNGKERSNIGSWFCDSPSYSYMKLSAGDSGRFQTFASSSSSPSSNPTNSRTQIMAYSGGDVRSPRRRMNSHRVST